ncbi:hypothetical protein DUNSADRAFT_6117 [Dunaliella salina]|uniref:Uncharacterized protein n=1 Tax=Dunaliella salina TaxID=3046 RepID=A0ABQ7H717_DUNSA|nr:hypothetical protein DUNSADRAFT_6117 [Dunaliella salina]|eukprot:KAF5842647.1 hypothetical protein DUNSADRAFT_6117 [Dunaliella salina]
MGDKGQLVPFHQAGKGGDEAYALAPVLRRKTPEELEKEQEHRIEEAQKLEEKLKVINEVVPTKIYNTCSSSAGAGSGDFHMYRMIRKAEQERQKRLDLMEKQQIEMSEFEATRKERQEQAEQRTSKKRAKRLKKKAKKSAKVNAGGAKSTGSGAEEKSSSEEDEDGPAQAALD